MERPAYPAHLEVEDTDLGGNLQRPQSALTSSSAAHAEMVRYPPAVSQRQVRGNLARRPALEKGSSR